MELQQKGLQVIASVRQNKWGCEDRGCAPLKTKIRGEKKRKNSMIRLLKSLNQLSDCISSKLSKHCSTQQGAKHSGRYFCLKKEKKN